MNKQMEAVAEKLANMIIQALEEGKKPNWLKPWNVSGLSNITTGNTYNGYNPFWLNLYNQIYGYDQPYFITAAKLFKMATARKMRVQLDDLKRLCPISFFSFVEKDERNEKGEIVKTTRPVFTVHNVYNIQQIDGWETFFEKELAELATKDPVAPIEDLDGLFNGYFEKQSIKFTTGGDRAYFSPSMNKINLPKIEHFNGVAEYYSTLGHETIHATGLPLARFDVNTTASFGNDVYSEEELVAEIGAMMLASVYGFENERSVQNSEAYLIGWAKAFKAQPTIIFTAAQKAAKAVKHFKEVVGTTAE